MDRKNLIYALLYSLMILFLSLAACQKTDFENTDYSSGGIETIDDNIVDYNINNNNDAYSDEANTTIDTEFDEDNAYLEVIADELSNGSYKYVNLPYSGNGEIHGRYFYESCWMGDEEEMSSVITRVNLEDPNDYYKFDTNKIVDARGIFSSGQNGIEYFVGYNDVIERWNIDIDNNVFGQKDECILEEITTSQANLMDIYKDNNYYYFYYALWGDAYTNDGRIINEYRIYITDYQLNVIYFEDIPVCENVTNKLFFDDKKRLCYLGSDEGGYYIQQIKRNETDDTNKRYIGKTWTSQYMWQVYMYNESLWYISNGYIYKMDIDSGAAEKKYYLSSAGIEAEDFIYDWRIVSGVAEIIYPNKVIYIKVD